MKQKEGKMERRQTTHSSSIDYTHQDIVNQITNKKNKVSSIGQGFSIPKKFLNQIYSIVTNHAETFRGTYELTAGKPLNSAVDSSRSVTIGLIADKIVNRKGFMTKMNKYDDYEVLNFETYLELIEYVLAPNLDGILRKTEIGNDSEFISNIRAMIARIDPNRICGGSDYSIISEDILYRIGFLSEFMTNVLKKNGKNG